MELIRLKSLIQFRKKSGFSKIYEAIVDTGAPVSAIPLRIWEEANYQELAEHEIGGLAGGSVPVKVARMGCLLTDKEGNQTGELKIITYLAPTDRIPLIIGFKDILDHFKTYIDYKNREAYIKLKG